MNLPSTAKIALLLKTNYIYGREIVAGISQYMSGRRMSWVVFLREDFRGHIDTVENMRCDGMIVDFEDQELREFALHSKIPAVAVGSSYQDAADYPPTLSYVATDNFGLVRLAYEHLIEAGLPNFALLSLTPWQGAHWPRQREDAYLQLMQRDKLDIHIYREPSELPTSWDVAVEQLASWVHTLPKPVGIIAINDGRAKQLLQACVLAGIAVPEQVAIIGIDNDPIARTLTRIPLSSVIHGTQEIGQIAARMLHQRLNGVQQIERVIVPPVGVNKLASTQHQRLNNPQVMRARHFIRQYACVGIKTQQVADYVGISRSSLESHYKAELGYSVHDEILRFKLDAAKSILARDACNLSEVSVACGFTSVHYMHNVFKRELGCSPRAYQANIQANIQASIRGTAEVED